MSAKPRTVSVAAAMRPSLRCLLAQPKLTTTGVIAATYWPEPLLNRPAGRCYSHAPNDSSPELTG